MNEIRVECYAGYRPEERPLRFVIRGREFLVDELDGRWFSPGPAIFAFAPMTAIIMSCATTRPRIPGRLTVFAPLVANSRNASRTKS